MRKSRTLITDFSGLIHLSFSEQLGEMQGMPTTVPTSASRNKPKLLNQVRDVIRRKHFSIRTEQAYVD